jgi:hypothetical protein
LASLTASHESTKIFNHTTPPKLILCFLVRAIKGKMTTTSTFMAFINDCQLLLRVSDNVSRHNPFFPSEQETILNKELGSSNFESPKLLLMKVFWSLQDIHKLSYFLNPRIMTVLSLL